MKRYRLALGARREVRQNAIKTVHHDDGVHKGLGLGDVLRKSTFDSCFLVFLYEYITFMVYIRATSVNVLVGL